MLRSAFLAVCILSAICFVAYAASLSSLPLGKENITIRNTNIHFVYLELIVLAYIAPVLAFSFQMKKSAADSYFTLPLKRSKLYFASTLVGLFYILVPFTVAYWGGFLALLIRQSNAFEMLAYFPGYIGGVLFGICIFGINSFAFTRANNLLDGIILMAGYSLVLWLVLTYMQKVMHVLFLKGIAQNSLPIFAIINFADGIEKMILGENGAFSGWTFLFPSVMAIVSYLLLFVTLPHKKAEEAEQISDSWFAYKTLIPLFTATILGSVTLNALNVYLAAVGTVVATLVYARKWRIHWRSWVLIGVSLALGILLNVLVGMGDLPVINPPSEMWAPILCR